MGINLTEKAHDIIVLWGINNTTERKVLVKSFDVMVHRNYVHISFFNENTINKQASMRAII